MNAELQAILDAWRDVYAADPRLSLCDVAVVIRGDGPALVGDTLDEATAPLAMGPDLFFDGRAADAAQPDRFLAGFEIARR